MDLEEKIPHVVTEPLARGRSAYQRTYDVEHNRTGWSTQSVLTSLKTNYAITELPADESGTRIARDYTHRKLKPRHISLIAIGGTIGPALFVQIGRGLMHGGPASLLLAFVVWCTFILCVNNCMAEMVSWTPISAPLMRFAGRYVDEAFGFAAGWNYFLFQAALVPFEIVQCTFVIHFWSTEVPDGGVIAIIIFIYAMFNIFAVKWYGESEFWLAIGKVILILGLIVYTIFTMVGINPRHDSYGFRFWHNPGAFAEYYTTGNTGRFMGFLYCLILASFTVAGPDYVSMTAGEAENPRQVLPRAYNAIFYRLAFFFCLGALCVGIVTPYDDPSMQEAFGNDSPGVTASPFVISMVRLGIPVLPHIVNAMVLSAALSAGNSYAFCASRSLYGLALEGKAPGFLLKCTNNGVPVNCVAVVLAISLLSFLQVNNSAWTVLLQFVKLLINFAIMSFTYIKFRKAMAAQGYDRAALPYKAWWQPYSAWYALIGCTVMIFLGGYEVFLKGNWNIGNFMFSYTMVGIVPVLFFGWKFTKRTKWLRPSDVDLTQDHPDIYEYERTYVPKPPRNALERNFDKLFN